MMDLEPLETQCEWTADALTDESIWTEVLREAELEEADTALRHAMATSKDILDIDKEDFPLQKLGSRLARIEDELINGRGFVRIRGIERNRYDQSEMEMLYWGIGMHLGKPWAQNKHGHMLGDVTDQGRATDDPEARGNELGGIALPFHTDGSDLVGLLCLQNGTQGGLSRVANSVTIHNQLVRESPELAAEFYKPQPFDFRGEQPQGGVGWYTVPIFTQCAGRLFVRCIPPYTLASQRHADAPRLTDQAKKALARVVELADDPMHHISMALLPGDMQFINNYHVMHGRSAYQDDRLNRSVRHLKRLWLETRALKQRPEYFQNSHSDWTRKRSASRMTVN
ncbi:MAG: TauD/TfdA family dioxygenase [Myxococcota bacterium]|nr:TauD/TfdA family dioxygenase [Myxococcota bacterium]